MSTVVLTDKHVVCRKPHFCEWCGEMIKKSERAYYCSGIFEGDFFHYHMHMECGDASDRSDLSEGFMPHEQKRGMTMED